MASERLAANLRAVEERIAAACARAGRSREDVRLIAVSKTHPAGVLRTAIAAGLRTFGENRVQEAESKISEIGGTGVEWHLIGHLQANKARKAVQLFNVVHTLDSVELASRLERICSEEGRGSLTVLLQVDLAGEQTKAGVPEEGLGDLVAFVRRCGRLELAGLMTIPPFFEDPELVRPFFRRLRELRDEVVPGGELSMGMSHDLEAAIEEGSTMVRVGTAIFGERETNI